MGTVIIKNRGEVEVHDLEIGMVVGFKSDVEQYGKIASVDFRNQTVTLVANGTFDGDYIGGETTTVERIQDLWID